MGPNPHRQPTGDLSIMGHLAVERVDLCTYGNTMPFRVRIVNRMNDNFDYFYVKNADASRIYRLELEDILSPNAHQLSYQKPTLIEEHSVGIPGDLFLKHRLSDPDLNPIRLCKEFVKFNEPCFIRLLGDMHSANFVVGSTRQLRSGLTWHYHNSAFDRCQTMGDLVEQSLTLLAAIH